MAVTEVQAKSAKASLMPGSRKYTVSYQAKTDDRNDGPKTVASDSRLPGISDTYSFGNESDTGAFRTGYPDVTPVSVKDSLMLWNVTITFETPAAASMSGAKLPQIDTAQVDYPWDVPAEISGDFISHVEDMWEDADGTAVVNTANGAFPEQPTREVDFPTLVIKKAYQPGTFSLAMLNDFRNSVNDNVFFGMSADTWRLIRSPWQRLYMAGYAHYYSVQYEFAADPEKKWAVTPIDEGYLDANGKVPKDEDGFPRTGFGYLDGFGDWLGKGEVPIWHNGEVNSTGGGNWPGPYYPYKQRNFALLGIPTALP